MRGAAAAAGTRGSRRRLLLVPQMASMPPAREEADRMDREDELWHVRDRFVVPEGTNYLDGNSLGVLPRGVAARLQEVVEKEWGQDLIRSWNCNGWMERPYRTGNKIAKLVGGGRGNIVVADSTSVNLFKALGAALKLRPGRSVIVSETGNFPTDLYMIQGMLGLLPDSHSLTTVAPADLAATLSGDDGVKVACVCLTHVNYQSGRMHDMAAVTKLVHAAGALMIWDLAHSAGAVEVDLLGVGADFAFGCGYKYLNGGPGAPSFIFCNPALQESAESPLAGWLGHARPFAFVPEYEPAPGIGRFVCGTPNVLSDVALDVALDAFDGVTMAAVRAKSAALGDFFIQLVESRCAAFCDDHGGLALASPRDAAVRGSQVSFSHEHGYPIMQALIARGVIGDFRAPNILRFGFTPLYMRFADVFQAVEVLAQVLEEKTWDEERFHKRQKVT